jgi:hypothetical protein
MGAICRLETTPDGKPEVGLLWNLSATGVSMLVHTPREAGTIITGALETLTGNHTLVVTGRVVHIKKLETGDYFMGAHFTHPITDHEMKPFVT